MRFPWPPDTISRIAVGIAALVVLCLMGLDYALAYTQLSESSFRFLARRRDVAPVECEGLTITRWRRADLDRLIDSLPRRGAPIGTDAPDLSAAESDGQDAGEMALARARRRSRK